MPQPTDITAAYWQAAQQEKLLLQHCQQCQNWQFFPRAFCCHCGSEDLSWQASAGKGKIYTFTINRRATHAFFKERLPYAVAMVELEEGPCMMANIIDSDLSRIAIGAKVQVCFERASDEITLPQFRLV
ncbi:Zn-ribbon domain-containing OB-fold protein [Comamonas sp. J-3]|uniref:Zn-ribbon domain-containing OB-fold protein n=1 Tax=Comamonas trifloxystrobinivorans TaxID=3350256 RepID=UPI00372D7557